MTSDNEVSRRMHQAMQIISAISLLFFAGMLHLHEVEQYQSWWWFCIWGSAAIYPFYVLEMLILLVRKEPAWKRHVLYCILPPLRLMAPHPITGEVWLPRIGWTQISSELSEGAEKAFATPMIVIALLILPVMGIEHYYEHQLEQMTASAEAVAVESSVATASLEPSHPLAANPLFQLGISLATCVIWLAFTIEFVVMMSLQNKKLKYCVKHWLDLAIILLPLIAFLRAARLTRLARLQRLSKTARIYRMRGTLIKLQRAIMLMSIVKRMLHARPEARLKSLEEKLIEKTEEIRLIREEMAELHERIAMKQDVQPVESQVQQNAA